MRTRQLRDFPGSYNGSGMLAESPQQTEPGAVVLVVDDEPRMIQFIRMNLERCVRSDGGGRGGANLAEMQCFLMYIDFKTK